MTCLSLSPAEVALLERINASPLGGWSVVISQATTQAHIDYLRWEITGCNLRNPLHTRCLAALEERAGALKREHYQSHLETLEML